MKLNFIKMKNNTMTWKQVETKGKHVFMRMKYRTRKVKKVPKSFFN